MNLLPSRHKSKDPVTYNPRFGSGLSSLQREMNSLMNNFFEWNDNLSPWSLSPMTYPTVDVREEDNKYFVDADVPGMNDKDISVDVRNNILTISGKINSETKSDDKGYAYFERTHESFSRDIYLADEVDLDSVKAELKNGVLHIEMNKSEAAKTNHKKITIKH